MRACCSAIFAAALDRWPLSICGISALASRRKDSGWLKDEESCAESCGRALIEKKKTAPEKTTSPRTSAMSLPLFGLVFLVEHFIERTHE
jgi:hypothetical protein